mmetsp:Transcript_16526/g.28932  ORF Transcript_16526/g.28932 Transcript_16526/m.28932 type:complete len:295 (-) Transcript_16526:706-1590(-)
MLRRSASESLSMRSSVLHILSSVVGGGGGGGGSDPWSSEISAGSMGRSSSSADASSPTVSHGLISGFNKFTNKDASVVVCLSKPVLAEPLAPASFSFLLASRSTSRLLKKSSFDWEFRSPTKSRRLAFDGETESDVMSCMLLWGIGCSAKIFSFSSFQSVIISCQIITSSRTILRRTSASFASRRARSTSNCCRSARSCASFTSCSFSWSVSVCVCFSLRSNSFATAAIFRSSNVFASGMSSVPVWHRALLLDVMRASRSSRSCLAMLRTIVFPVSTASCKNTKPCCTASLMCL